MLQIKNVNMNLDQTPNEYRIKAKNLNTEKILVNKYYYLEEDYVPDNLQTINRKYALSNMRMVNVAKEAFESLSAAAQKEDLNIIAMSTYRSYTYQVNLYNRYKKERDISEINRKEENKIKEPLIKNTKEKNSFLSSNSIVVDNDSLGKNNINYNTNKNYGFRLKA